MAEKMFKTLSEHNCSWLKGKLIWHKYQDFWTTQRLHDGGVLSQENFMAEISDILLCSCPKTGTTWLKALAFVIVTREKFSVSTSPLLTTLIHESIPFLETDLDIIGDNHKNTNFPLIATNLQDGLYIYHNIKDVIVSQYHFLRESLKLRMEDAPFKEAFDEFCQGFSYYGPYWDHTLRYWKAGIENPGRILFLKFEDMKRDPTSNVKRLVEFIGYCFALEEEKAGVAENIIKLCRFETLTNLEVNKSGKHRLKDNTMMENRFYFRKMEIGTTTSRMR